MSEAAVCSAVEDIKGYSDDGQNDLANVKVDKEFFSIL